MAKRHPVGGRLRRAVGLGTLLKGELKTVDCDNCGNPVDVIDFDNLTHFETRGLCDSCRRIKRNMKG